MGGSCRMYVNASSPPGKLPGRTGVIQVNVREKNVSDIFRCQAVSFEPLCKLSKGRLRSCLNKYGPFAGANQKRGYCMRRT